MKNVFYFVLLAVFMTAGSVGSLHADTKKKYHINEDFANNVLPTKPSTWIVRATGSSNESTNPPYGGAAGVEWKDGMLVLSATNGGGQRGAEITFPTPQSNPTMNISDTVWMEFDWTITSATVAERNALALIVMDSLNTTSAPRPIFGLYMAGTDGFVHYWNMDLLGPETSVTGEYYGAVFTAANGGGGFRRAGTSADETNSLNASTRTEVAYAAGNTYHVTVGLNFVSKRVAVLTITQADSPENTQTIADQPFIDEAATTLGSVATVNTRGSNISNGNTVTFNVSYDNLEVYMLAPSMGKADVTVHYKDRDGGLAKASRVVENYEVEEVYSLLTDDKKPFAEGGSYFAYDADATHAANAEKGADGESVTVALGGSSLDVVFKKSSIIGGTYVWTGNSSNYWNELDNNFSVSGGADMSYQPGNAVEFSKADALYKEVDVNGVVDLGSQNMTISASDYAFASSGSGEITGEGSVIVDVATVLGAKNTMSGGAVINTASPTTLKHASAAKKYRALVDGVTLRLQTVSAQDAAVALPIEGMGGKIHLEVDSLAPYNVTISEVPEVNLSLNQEGRMRNTRWTTAFSGAFAKGSQVNVSSGIRGLNPSGFGVTSQVLDSVKVHLGDYVRLVREYNEAATGADVVYIGELTGSESSFIEGGWVDGRAMIYNIGSLGTDAVFDGSIRPYQTITAATETEEEVTTIGNSGIRIVKVGAGTWTINGIIDLPNSTLNRPSTTTVNYCYNYINAQEGTLVLKNKVYFPDNDTITHQVNVKVGATLELWGDLEGLPAVNQSTLQVDSGAVLKSHDIRSSLRNTYIYGTLEGSITVPDVIAFYENSVIKLRVNSFAGGDFDRVDAAGDIVVALGAVLDVTVVSAPQGSKVQLLQSGGNLDLQFEKILVNGEDITENTAETPGATCYFDRDTGELVALSDFTGIGTVDVDKSVKLVQYFDLLGRTVDKDATGFVIRSVTYTDGTKAAQKIYIRER
jgi:hypothetical protein